MSLLERIYLAKRHSRVTYTVWHLLRITQRRTFLPLGPMIQHGNYGPSPTETLLCQVKVILIGLVVLNSTLVVICSRLRLEMAQSKFGILLMHAVLKLTQSMDSLFGKLLTTTLVTFYYQQAWITLLNYGTQIWLNQNSPLEAMLIQSTVLNLHQWVKDLLVGLVIKLSVCGTLELMFVLRHSTGTIIQSIALNLTSR